MSVIVDAYGTRRRDQVMRSTWGHMDANPGTRYRGWIMFAEGAYGDLVVLACEFGNAGDGPWFYEGVNDWIADQDTEPGCVYRFDGLYRLGRDGAHIFDGVISPVKLGA